MDDIIKQLTVSIRNAIPAACRAHFDEALTHSMSKHSALEQLNGIKHYQKLAVVENAVEITSDRCHDLSHTHPTIQSFAVKPLFHALKQMSKLKQPSIKETMTVRSDNSCKHNTTAVDSSEPKQSTRKQNSKAKPSSTSEVSNLTKPDESLVYRELDTFKTKGNPFRTLAHINCDSAACGFCIGLYSHVNLTRCVGHKKCIPSGWFPHVGKALWSKLKKTHDSGVQYSGRTQTVREHELPCLVNRSAESISTDEGMESETLSIVSQTDQSDIESEVASTVYRSPTPAESVTSRMTHKTRSSRGGTPVKRLSPAKSAVILQDLKWHTGKSSKPARSNANSSN